MMLLSGLDSKNLISWTWWHISTRRQRFLCQVADVLMPSLSSNHYPRNNASWLAGSRHLISPYRGTEGISENYRYISLTTIYSKVLWHTVYSSGTDSHVITPRGSMISVRAKPSWFFRLMTGQHPLIVACDPKWRTLTSARHLTLAPLPPHQRLIVKRQSFETAATRWYGSLLSFHREQRAVVNGSQPSWLHVKHLLGFRKAPFSVPPLFPIAHQHHREIRLFADDCNLYRTISNITDCHSTTSWKTSIDKLFAWSTVWQMQFNYTKCRIPSITQKDPNQPPSTHLLTLLTLPIYSLGAATLSRVDLLCILVYLTLLTSAGTTTSASVQKLPDSSITSYFHFWLFAGRQSFSPHFVELDLILQYATYTRNVRPPTLPRT